VYVDECDRSDTQVRKTNLENWFKRSELRMTLFRLAALRLGLFCSYFLVTLLALLIFLYLTNAVILAMIGQKTLSFSKTRTILRVT
jgi:hypothetical protein